MKINKIPPENSKYLQITSGIAKNPKSLYFIGKLPEKRLPTVAIVGTRKPTSYGKEVAQRLAQDLARKGIVIVSGLALGIDGIAHRGALEAGGTTIAVLGNGLPDIYPASHQQLASHIIESGGAIISEYERGTPALPHQFLERNRLVSGISDAIIIVEAAKRSGTLNTTMHALDQGREVFVVPGNITSPLSAGCNALLKQGAHPVTCTQDILDALHIDHNAPQQMTLGETDEENTILELLQSGIRDGSILQEKSALDASAYGRTMTMLEIKGIIFALGANQWSLR